MSNLNIKNFDLAGIIIGNPEYDDKLVTFAGADILAAGTIMAVLTASGKLQPFDIGGAGGLEIPKYILTVELEATGAGDLQTRALKSGKVRREKLVIDNGGTITDVQIDQLRDFTIIANPVDELNIQDNQ